jgi:glutaredoxin 3
MMSVGSRAMSGERTGPGLRSAAVLLLAGLLGSLLVPSCSRGSTGDSSTRPKPPAVRESSTELTFFWFDSTGAVHRVERIADIPLEARDRVLVQPLDPRATSGAWAFVADLRRAGTDGTYPVQVLTREAYSNEVRARMAASHPEQAQASTPTTGAAGPAAPTNPNAGAPLPADGKLVEMYSTPGCPYCRQAREWMTKLGIPFVDHNIEEDQAAARWVLQNTGSTSVPVFRIGTRVLQGFNQGALRRAVQEELGLQLL